MRPAGERTGRGEKMSDRLRWGTWAFLGVVLAVALAIGASRPAPAPSDSRRAAAIDSALRCPSCDGISVANSSASTAVAIRRVVAQRVRSGESTAQIETYLESRYGPGILLDPPATGGTAVVWIAPLLAVIVGGSGLGVFFWRRRRPPAAVAGGDDGALVEEALATKRTPRLEVGSLSDVGSSS
jgi:cytochrome c-type biogenesis protein CcmH